MGFFDRFFGRRPRRKRGETAEYLKIKEFDRDMSALLAEDRYLARSDFSFLAGKYADVYSVLSGAKKMGTLSYYCRKNRIPEGEVISFLSRYVDVSDLPRGSAEIDRHNAGYVARHMESEREYLDTILGRIDPSIMLDNEQREAVLSDEDYTLIIAGAGSGKTTTVAAKVRYLVERQGIKPEEILVISYTNKAVGELRARINDGLSIPCPVTTFHKTGNEILRTQGGKRRKVAGEGFLPFTVNNYFRTTVLTHSDIVGKLIMFFGSYFDIPYEGDDVNLLFDYLSGKSYVSMKSNLREYSVSVTDRLTRRLVTIKNETMRSAQEVRIANFLYMNGIDYVYEEIYPYHILKAKKPYTPDFRISQDGREAYIEHFGITESGDSSFYSPEELERYRCETEEKKRLHAEHGTTLLYTYSSYRDGRDLLDHLKEQLEGAGFELRPRPSDEVFRKIISHEENTYIARMVDLVTVFIENFKVNGYTAEKFDEFSRTANVRGQLFFDICKACYLEYGKRLEEEDMYDFADMINLSARIISEKKNAGESLPYKYIIVDEYQDISRQRFDLTRALSEVCSAKVVAVGDDWQSIYAFSGSDIDLFTHFSETMGYAKELRITRTYRNAQEVIDIAGGFIQKNTAQIRKSLVSDKHIRKAVVVQSYSESCGTEYRGRGRTYYNLGKELADLIGRILEENRREGKPFSSSILLIGRFNFDVKNLCYSGEFVYNQDNGRIICRRYPKINLGFMTAHSSKGLGYDNVVIINGVNGRYGFPSKIDDDPLLSYVTKQDTSIEYAEERRLFYVALTRTKNRVFIMCPEKHPSQFVRELIDDYPGITVRGNVSRDSTVEADNITRCPVCGYPLRLKFNRNYGMRLWICTNEPEICTFMTNNLKGGTMSVQKCDSCRDGYLVVKEGEGGMILGCTNYRPDRRGCNRVISEKNYAKWLTDGFEYDISADKPGYFAEAKEKKVISPPKIKTRAVPAPDTGKAPGYYVTDRVLRNIEKDGFMVVSTTDGKILTDMGLLAHLRALRRTVAAELSVKPSEIMMKEALVSLATFRPTGREDFVSLRGLTERIYSVCGERFMQAIREYDAKPRGEGSAS